MARQRLHSLETTRVGGQRRELFELGRGDSQRPHLSVRAHTCFSVAASSPTHTFQGVFTSDFYLFLSVIVGLQIFTFYASYHHSKPFHIPWSQEDALGTGSLLVSPVPRGASEEDRP